MVVVSRLLGGGHAGNAGGRRSISPATAANTVAKPLDNDRPGQTTLEYRPSTRLAPLVIYGKGHTLFAWRATRCARDNAPLSVTTRGYAEQSAGAAGPAASRGWLLAGSLAAYGAAFRCCLAAVEP